jgi:hypothetical protein
MEKKGKERRGTREQQEKKKIRKAYEGDMFLNSYLLSYPYFSDTAVELRRPGRFSAFSFFTSGKAGDGLPFRI